MNQEKKKYIVMFKLHKSKKWHKWEWWGVDMEDTLKEAKKAIRLEYNVNRFIVSIYSD